MDKSSHEPQQPPTTTTVSPTATGYLAPGHIPPNQQNNRPPTEPGSQRSDPSRRVSRVRETFTRERRIAEIGFLTLGTGGIDSNLAEQS